MQPDQVEDAISLRLSAFAAELERTMGDSLVIRREDLFSGAVWVTPVRPGALGVTWLDMGWDLQVQTLGGPGGRWELGRTDRDVDFIEDVARAVVAGRVTEVRVANRSRVVVRLADGSEAVETGSAGLSGCLPLPLWPRWGRRTDYLPYVG